MVFVFDVINILFPHPPGLSLSLSLNFVGDGTVNYSHVRSEAIPEASSLLDV